MVPGYRLCFILVSVLLQLVTVRGAIAQGSPADSAKGSHLSVHLPLPLPIPFLHHRQHAGRTRSAEPDSAFLRVEVGYDGNFNSPELSRDVSTSVTVIVRPMSHFEVQGDLDVRSLAAPPRDSAITGRGDARLTVQWTTFTIHPGHIAVALAYEAKFPTARPDTLGSGRMDHRFLTPISFAYRGVEVDAYGGVDADGQANGFDWGLEGAASATVQLVKQLSAYAGVSAQAVDTDLPAGRYVSAGVSWQIRPLLAIDLGGRFGVSPRTPAYGLTAGVTAALVTRQPTHP